MFWGLAGAGFRSAYRNRSAVRLSWFAGGDANAVTWVAPENRLDVQAGVPVSFPAGARWLGESAAWKGTTLSTQTKPTLALIHTSPTLAAGFTKLCHLHIPEAKLFHMVDESLIQDTVKSGYLRKATIRRLIEQIASAEEAGANAVLVTCSSIGPGVTAGAAAFRYSRAAHR